VADLRQRTFGDAGVPLAALDDRELLDEVRRRRERRAGGRGAASPRTAAGERPAGPPASASQVRQWYANLELSPGADATAVEAAYERLIRRYDPDRHRNDPAKHRAALELTRSLTRAYRGLAAHLGAAPTPRP
jgi:DnaJ-domain-containing protein 1